MTTFTFDTETTGVEPGSRMLELHCCLLDSEEQAVAELSSMVNPGMPIPADAGRIHGITDAQLADAPTTKAALQAWLSWLEEHRATVGIAHNAPYDVGILGWALGACGLHAPAIRIVDTCAMAKAMRRTPNNRLDTLVAHYGLTRDGAAHRARSDADAVRQLYHVIKDKVPHTPAAWAPEYRFPASPIPPQLAGIEQAIAKGERWGFAYVDAMGARTEREVIPYGFAETRGGLEFHGLCLLRNERRTFKADRVERRAAAAGA